MEDIKNNTTSYEKFLFGKLIVPEFQCKIKCFGYKKTEVKVLVFFNVSLLSRFLTKFILFIACRIAFNNNSLFCRPVFFVGQDIYATPKHFAATENTERLPSLEQVI